MPDTIVPAKPLARTVGTSLLALVGCAFAGHAFAAVVAPDEHAGSREFVARVAVIAGHVHSIVPVAESDRPAPVTVAQWRNYR